MRKRRGAAFAMMVCCSCELSAQPTSADRIVGSFTNCRAIAAPAERLRCFEEATTALEGQVAAKRVTILDREDVTKARKSLFGFTVPRIALFGGGSDGPAGGAADRRNDLPEFDELNTTIVSIRPAANGRLELRLAEDEAVWVTTDPMPFAPKPGARIRIRKGALGNYFLTIDGARSVRGMRLR